MPIIREKQSNKQTNKTFYDRVDNNTIHAKPRFHYILKISGAWIKCLSTDVTRRYQSFHLSGHTFRFWNSLQW